MLELRFEGWRPGGQGKLTSAVLELNPKLDSVKSKSLNAIGRSLPNTQRAEKGMQNNPGFGVYARGGWVTSGCYPGSCTLLPNAV